MLWRRPSAGVFKGLEYSFDLLTDNPKMGRLFDKEIRRYVYKSHLVYYEVKKNQLLIIRVRNARQKP